MKIKLIFYIGFIFISLTPFFSLSGSTLLPGPPEGFVPMEKDSPGKLPPADYEKKRLDIFANEDISKLQYGTVFLGDSITEGFKIETYFPKELVIDRGIVSEGMGGYQAFGTYNRLESTVYNLHPKRIIMMIGVNNTPRMTADSTEVKLLQYDYLVWKIRHDLPDTQLWCISLLPTRGKYAYLNPRITTFNQHIREVSKKYNALWLDVHKEFLDSNHELKEEFTRDGLHPNSKGYDLLAKIYHENIFK